MPLPRKLTPENVAYARAILRRRQQLVQELEGLPDERALARELRVSPWCLRRLRDGETYRDVADQ